MAHAPSVQHQLPIVMYVHQQRNVQHVQIHIIQVDQHVHYARVNIVQHVMHQVESVQHVKVDII